MSRLDDIQSADDKAKQLAPVFGPLLKEIADAPSCVAGVSPK